MSADEDRGPGLQSRTADQDCGPGLRIRTADQNCEGEMPTRLCLVCRVRFISIVHLSGSLPVCILLLIYTWREVFVVVWPNASLSGV